MTRARYPDLRIPFHSRWRHFEAGGVDRRRDSWTPQLGAVDAAERARAQIDLAVVSVLLDAGAGAATGSYREASSGAAFSPLRRTGRGELCTPSCSGLFSSDPARPLQADATGLQSVTADALAAAFQVAPANPLVGLDGRVALLHRLGARWRRNPGCSGLPGAPGALFDHLLAQQPGPRAGGGARHPGPAAGHACRASGRLTTPSAARRWATAGATPPCPGRA